MKKALLFLTLSLIFFSSCEPSWNEKVNSSAEFVIREKTSNFPIGMIRKINIEGHDYYYSAEYKCGTFLTHSEACQCKVKEDE